LYTAQPQQHAASSELNVTATADRSGRHSIGNFKRQYRLLVLGHLLTAVIETTAAACKADAAGLTRCHAEVRVVSGYNVGHYQLIQACECPGRR